MDRLLGMEVFVAAVELGSFTAVAERFGLSQPMVGKHVAALEARLGGRLLARTTRRQQPTELGQHYYQRCLAILAEVRAAEDAAALLSGAPRGLLRVNASVTYGSLKLAPVVAAFMRRYPEVRVELTLSDALADLVDDGHDVLVRIGPLREGGWVARPLAPYRMLVAAAPSYLAARGRPQTPAELAAHDCLGFSGWRRDDGWAWMARRYGVELGEGRLSCNNGQALRQLALAGAGLVFQAEALLADDVAAGRLEEVLADYLPPPSPVHLLVLPDRQRLPKLSAFLEFARQSLGER